MSGLMKNGLSISAIVLFGVVAAGLSGCGGSQGVTSGASSPTSIVIKHGKDKSEAPVASAEKGGAPASSSAAPAASGGVGSLKGRVTFQGQPPKLESLTALAQTKEPVCAKAGIPNDKLVIGDGNGVANVFVFLPKAPGGVAVPPVPADAVKFDQKDCRFFPHALVLRTGQDLKILNSDAFTHNTHTYATRSDNFNQSIPPHDTAGVDFKYPKSEAKPAEVKCDIHSWMRAYHLPLDHPWAAVSGPNGEYEIKNIPAGEYKFQVWHEAAGGGGYLDRNLSVTIKPGEATTKDITYDASKVEG